MADFMDLISANVIGNWISNPNYGRNADDDAAHQRATNIQDNFGVKPISLEEFRSKSGGSGWLKGLGIAAAITAVGAALAFTPLGLTALAVAVTVGLIGAVMYVGVRSAHTLGGYNNYLDKVASMGRELQGKSISMQQLLASGAAPSKSHTAQLDAARAQAPATGTTR